MNTYESRTATAPGRHFLSLPRLFALLVVAATLSGCMPRYDVLLTNGDRLTNVRKPTLNRQGGYYSYVSGNGQRVFLTASRVVEIQPHQKEKVSKIHSAE